MIRRAGRRRHGGRADTAGAGYGTAERLRRNGFSADDVAALLKLRTAYEDYLRGHRDRAEVQAAGTVVRLPGCGHEPSGQRYTDALLDWFSAAAPPAR